VLLLTVAVFRFTSNRVFYAGTTGRGGA